MSYGRSASLKTIAEQLVELGVVEPSATPEAMRARRTPPEVDLDSIESTPDPRPVFDQPQVTGPIPSAPLDADSPLYACRGCGSFLSKDLMVRVDLCLHCGGSDVKRVRGHMEWVHKSVPVLTIEGREAPNPEDYAAMRRR